MKVSRSAVPLALLATVSWVSVAQSQTAAAGSRASDPAATPGLESANDIIVTALKRGDTVLKTPATVTVLSQQNLASKNVTNVNQFSGIVPGLVMTPAVGGLPGTSFRGLGSNSAVFGMESSVAEYIDGVYLGHTRDFVTPLYDVDHVEFIKGTQATLLGKNTSLGAISIVNKRPSSEESYDLQLTHSFDINENKAEGAVNIPVTDTLQIRAAGLYSKQDGYYRNTYYDRDEVRLRDVSGRLSVEWQPLTDLDTVFIYQHDDRHAVGQDIGIISDPVGIAATRAGQVGVTSYNTGPVALTANGSSPLVGTTPGEFPFDNEVSNKLNWINTLRLSDFTLTAQTAYVRWTSERSVDFDFTPAHLFNLNDNEGNRVFSQELRLASPTDKSVSFILGGFYYRNTWTFLRTYDGSPSNTIGYPLTGSTTNDFRAPTRAVSGFASATWKLFDGFKLLGGLRYTREKKEASIERAGTGTFAAAFPNIAPYTFTPKITHPLDFNVGASYQATSSILAYASYSKGSKSGGFIETPTTISGSPYNSETAYSAEAGLKARLARGSLTATIFNTRVKNFQINYTNIPPGGGIIQSLVGNANVRSRGFEAAGTYTLLPGFSVNANVVYAKASFEQDLVSAAGLFARTGDDLTRAPRWTGQAGFDYKQPLSARLTLVGSASLSFSSHFLLQFASARPDAPRSDAWQRLDAQIGIQDRLTGIELSVIGTNLNNEQHVTFAAPLSAAGSTIGQQPFYGTISRPRVIALQLTFHR